MSLYSLNFHFRNNSKWVYKASAFNMSVTVFHCGFQHVTQDGRWGHLLNKGMTSSLINANRPLCRGLTGWRSVNVLLFPLRDSGRGRHLTVGLTESRQYYDGRSLWTLKACFLPLIALADLKHIRSPWTEKIWVSYQKMTSVRGCAFHVGCSF